MCFVAVTLIQISLPLCASSFDFSCHLLAMSYHADGNYTTWDAPMQQAVDAFKFHKPPYTGKNRTK